MATVSRPMMQSANISRLITAAVINQEFRQLLLSNPEKAINTGYNGEKFSLERAEKELILSIRATSLADFAVKLSSAHPGSERCSPVRKTNPVYLL